MGWTELKRDLEEAERKAMQLCQLAGAMMLACKRLKALQEAHANASDDPCPCQACRIPLPDLSAEAIDKLVDESNAAHAELVSLRGRDATS